MSQRTLQSLRARVKAVAGDVEQAAGRVCGCILCTCYVHSMPVSLLTWLLTSRFYMFRPVYPARNQCVPCVGSWTALRDAPQSDPVRAATRGGRLCAGTCDGQPRAADSAARHQVCKPKSFSACSGICLLLTICRGYVARPARAELASITFESRSICSTHVLLIVPRPAT